MRGRLFSCPRMIPYGSSYAGIRMDEKICAAVGSGTGQEYVQGSTFIALKYEYFDSQLWR